MDHEDFRSIKVPKWVYDNLEEGKLRLSRKGLEALPQEILSPKKCPVCGGKMKAAESGSGKEFLECAKCGYVQQKFSTDSTGAFIGGVVVGLGLAALIAMLMRD